MECRDCPKYDHATRRCMHPASDGMQLHPYPDDECEHDFEEEDVEDDEEVLE